MTGETLKAADLADVSRLSIEADDKQPSITGQKDGEAMIQIALTWLAMAVVLPTVGGFMAMLLKDEVTRGETTSLGLFAVRCWFVGTWVVVSTTAMMRFVREKKGEYTQEQPKEMVLGCVVVPGMTMCLSTLIVFVADASGSEAQPLWVFMVVFITLATISAQFWVSRTGKDDLRDRGKVAGAHILLGTQIMVTLTLGNLFPNWRFSEQIIFCACYPFFILSFRLSAQFLTSGLNKEFYSEIKLQSMIMAAFPYKLVLFSLDSWGMALSVMAIEVTWKVIVYVFDLKRWLGGLGSRWIQQQLHAVTDKSATSERASRKYSTDEKGVWKHEADTAFSFLFHQLEDGGDTIIFLCLQSFASFASGESRKYPLAIDHAHLRIHASQTAVVMVITVIMVMLVPWINKGIHPRHSFKIDMQDFRSLPVSPFSSAVAVRVMSISISVLWT